MIKPNAAKAVESRQQLSKAVKANDVKQLQSLLNSGASPNTTDTDGIPALKIACRCAAAECVQLLLDSGADIEAPDYHNKTVLHTAVLSDAVAAVNMLLTNGASVQATDSRKQTPLHFAKSGEVVALLLSSGADIEVRDSEGRTPLHLAVSNCFIGAVTALLQRGASASAVTIIGITPLHYAYYSEIITMLLRYGAGIEARDSNGEAPLHYTCGLNRVIAVKALIKAGANVHTMNDKGETPLHIATSKHPDGEVIQALITAGARLDIRNNAGKLAYDIACASKLDKPLLNILRPAAVSSSAVQVDIASNTDSKVVALDNALAVEPSAATAAVVATSSSVSDIIENPVTTQSSHTLTTTPTTPASSDVNVLDTWLCKWLIEIGFAETEACTYTAALTTLKVYTATPLAKLTEVKATTLATKAGISEFEIDMFIEGWQQLKLTHQLTISTATSQSITPVSSPPVSPVAVQASVSNSRPQSPISLLTDPKLRYTDRHIMTGTVSSSVFTAIYQAIDHNTRRAVVLKRSPLSMTIAAKVSYSNLRMIHYFSAWLLILACTALP
jgi:ankyrin repeat protein